VRLGAYRLRWISASRQCERLAWYVVALLVVEFRMVFLSVGVLE